MVSLQGAHAHASAKTLFAAGHAGCLGGFPNQAVHACRASDTAARVRDEVLGGAADMVLHVGDIAYANGDIAIWDTFMDEMEPYASAVPYMIGIGNHEVCPAPPLHLLSRSKLFYLYVCQAASLACLTRFISAMHLFDALRVGGLTRFALPLRCSTTTARAASTRRSVRGGTRTPPAATRRTTRTGATTVRAALFPLCSALHGPAPLSLSPWKKSSQKESSQRTGDFSGMSGSA